MIKPYTYTTLIHSDNTQNRIEENIQPIPVYMSHSEEGETNTTIPYIYIYDNKLRK